jgi:hypothetical protein
MVLNRVFSAMSLNHDELATTYRGSVFTITPSICVRKPNIHMQYFSWWRMNGEWRDGDDQNEMKALQPTIVARFPTKGPSPMHRVRYAGGNLIH